MTGKGKRVPEIGGLRQHRRIDKVSSMAEATSANTPIAPTLPKKAAATRVFVNVDRPRQV
jgi:hypothetical protein